MILLLDNRDSFTFNVAEVLRVLGADVRVERSRDLGWRDVRDLRPRGIVVGPGPGTPAGAGCSEDVVRELSASVPILGVCLGHQAMATAWGGRLRRAREPAHGRTTPVHHDGRGLFHGLPSPLDLVRYHSLVVDESSVPPELEITARDADGEVMGLRHRGRPLEGVQVHPEAVLCVDAGGRALFARFLERVEEWQGVGA